MSTTGAQSDVVSEQLVLAFDGLASNALRHGQPPVRAYVTRTAEGWFVDVSDAATTRPPAEDA